MPQTKPPKVDYYAGLSLGHGQERTALAVLERTAEFDARRRNYQEPQYAARHLERFAAGTPYPEVFTRLAELFAAPPLARATLVVDQTGVGRPVVDLLRRAKLKAELRRVTVSAGGAVGLDGRGGLLVPKLELVAVLQVLLQTRRVKLAAALPDADVLADEMLRFNVKVNAAADGAAVPWREGAQDDLVLAVAVAAWLAERERPQPAFVPYVLSSRFGWHR